MARNKRDMVAFHNSGTYTILVNRIVDSTEKIGCILRDEESKRYLGKRISLAWGGQGDWATVDTSPRDAYWEKALQIELTLGPFAYEKFHSDGKVCARYSGGNVFVEKVDNLEDYL